MAGRYGTSMILEKKPGKQKRRKVPYTRAGAVKVTKADGTTEILPSYTPGKLRSINARKRKRG